MSSCGWRSRRGSDIHGNQLDVYLEDILAHKATQKAVLLVAPRGQSFASSPPLTVAPVDWQSVSAVIATMAADPLKDDVDKWLLDEYAEYLREDGLMNPEALDVGMALALMEVDDAEEAAAGICEHADAWIAAQWGKRTNQALPRGNSTDPAYGLNYWANYEPNRSGEAAAPAWQGGWFEWGMRNTGELEYLNEDDIRGANVFYAGVTFEAKANPAKTAGNETWLKEPCAAGAGCWIGRRVRCRCISAHDDPPFG